MDLYSKEKQTCFSFFHQRKNLAPHPRASVKACEAKRSNPKGLALTEVSGVVSSGSLIKEEYHLISYSERDTRERECVYFMGRIRKHD